MTCAPTHVVLACALGLLACQPATALPAGGQCGTTVVPGAPGDGALRGCSGCAAPRASCATGEYEVSVACHGLPDGGSYAIGGVAGRWCYTSPPPCGERPSCECLMEHGAFAVDGGLGLGCAGSYWFCIDGTPPNLHCNPP